MSDSVINDLKPKDDELLDGLASWFALQHQNERGMGWCEDLPKELRRIANKIKVFDDTIASKVAERKHPTMGRDRETG